MKMFLSLVAVASLFGAVALVPVLGAVLISFVLFGLFLLALVGVIGESGDRTVRQHNPAMDPTGWRNGSSHPDADEVP